MSRDRQQASQMAHKVMNELLHQPHKSSAWLRGIWLGCQFDDSSQSEGHEPCLDNAFSFLSRVLCPVPSPLAVQSAAACEVADSLPAQTQQHSTLSSCGTACQGNQQFKLSWLSIRLHWVASVLMVLSARTQVRQPHNECFNLACAVQCT